MKASNPDAGIDLSAPVDINFLLDLDGWNEAEIKQLLLTIQKYKAAPYRMMLKEIYKRYFPSRSTIECGKVMREFKDAAENGLTFAEEMKSRKYRRDGNKVLAKATKNAKKT